MKFNELDKFTQDYIICAFWSTNDDSDPEVGGDPLDDNWQPDDLTWSAMRNMVHDCKVFQAAAAGRIEDDPGQAGHDFWLTRNGHGAGFWGPEKDEDFLTKLSEAFGECNLFVTDDQESIDMD